MIRIRPPVSTSTPVAIQRHATHGVTAPNALAKITSGIDAVRLCGKEHGMVLDHLEKLAKLAEQHNVVFAFRPTNYLATQLIAQGYPTKGIEVKGKSSDWGPMAGFIPVKQEFSKLSGDEKSIGEFDEKVQDCIKNKHAVPTPLVINQERIDELQKLGVMKVGRTSSNGLIEIHCTQNGKNHVFHGQPVGKNPADGYKILHQGEPFMVLGEENEKSGITRPMTADYDLFMFAHPFEDLGSQDNYKPTQSATGKALRAQLTKLALNRMEKELENKLESSEESEYVNSPISEPTSSFDWSRRSSATSASSTTGRTSRTSSVGSIESMTAISDMDSDSDISEPSSPGAWSRRTSASSMTSVDSMDIASNITDMGQTKDRGVISVRLGEFIPFINEILDRDEFNPVVHHGPDTHNDYTNMNDNLPCLFFAPKRLGAINGVAMARSNEEVAALFKEIKTDYQFFGNRKWTDELKPSNIRRASYDAARARLEAHMTRGSGASPIRSNSGDPTKKSIVAPSSDKLLT